MAEQPLVLIVDDEPDFLEIFGTKLQTAGFRVETALSAEEGIGKAKNLKPDLILMDIKMPGTSGAEAMLKLKEDPETRDIKTVFLTNLGEPREVGPDVSDRFSKEFGAAGYIKKTEDLDTLVEKVRAYLK